MAVSLRKVRDSSRPALALIEVRDNLGGPDVGQVVLPATPGGSPAAREWQVNVPLTRNNDLPYGFLGARRFRHGPPDRKGKASA